MNQILKTSLHLATTALATVALSNVAAAQGKLASGHYEVDAAHSKVGFEIPHLVISTVEGRFTSFQGSVDLADDFTKSKTDFSVDIASIDTDVSKRDDHLRSPDFFDVAKHPKMTFKSTAVTGTPASFKLKGDLTIKGVTKPVIFDAKYLGAVADGFGNQKTAFTATTKINRKDFGLTWNNVVEAGPVVGDDVTIEVRLEAGRPEKTKAE